MDLPNSFASIPLPQMVCPVWPADWRVRSRTAEHAEPAEAEPELSHRFRVVRVLRGGDAGLPVAIVTT
jgi:hypothetical protein